MSQESPLISNAQQRAATALQLGCLFFFLSGATALMYEIIWLRLLGLVFGNTTYALSTVLAAFMAGLGIGSYVVGRKAHRLGNPLKTYGQLELGIAVFAAFTLLLVKLIQTAYVQFAQHLDAGPAQLTLLRLALSFLIIFIPCYCMGATLPVLSRLYVHRSEEVGTRVALLYGLNTAGAVTGVVLTGFWLLPLLGIKGVLTLAVILNTAIGLAAIGLSRRQTQLPEEEANPEPAAKASERKRVGRWILPAGLAISGAAAMIFEVAWTRVLAAVIGSSTYAFTIMLATFLLGLALGSAWIKRRLRTRPATGTLWGLLQLGAAFSALAALPLYDDLGLVVVRLFSATAGHHASMQVLLFGVCATLMTLPAFCLGGIFPVSTALHNRSPSRIGQSVGSLYLANTLGNLAGSLGVGFVLIPWLGIHHSILLGIALAGISGLAALAGSRQPKPRYGLAAVLAVLLLTGGWINRSGWDPHRITAGLHVTPSRYAGKSRADILAAVYDYEVPFYREGINGIVNIGRKGGTTVLQVNGKIDASNQIDMRTQILSAHLPLFLHPHPEQTLIIGYGSGVTLASALAHPGVQADMVEIEQAVIDAGRYFDDVNHKRYEDPRARIIINDGRNHLLMNQRRYDVIISEPSNPWVAGLSYLYTKEFYTLAAEHMWDDGIFCQWLQDYSLAPADHRMVIRTLQSVFPHVTLWKSMGPDTLIIAGKQPLEVDLAQMQQRFDAAPGLAKELAPYHITGPAGLLSFFDLGEKDVRTYIAKGSTLNTDDRLPLEFHAPKSLYHTTLPLIRTIINAERTESLPPMAPGAPVLEKDPGFMVQLGYGFLGKANAVDAQRALACFTQALLLDPQHAGALTGSGRCYLLLAKPGIAQGYFAKASRQDPQLPDAHAYLGVAYIQTGEPAKGLQSLTKAVELDPKRWEYYQFMAQGLARLKQWKLAADAMRNARVHHPHQPDLAITWAQYLGQAGQTGAVIPVLEELKVQYPTYTPIHSTLLAAYLHTNQPGKAITLLEELVRANPYRAVCWGQLAQLYLKQGMADKAAWAVRQGKKIHPHLDEMMEVALSLSNGEAKEDTAAASRSPEE